MANNINVMDSLKEEAVRVYDGMTAVFPQFSEERVLRVSEMASKFNGCFATNNSTMCFISNNEVFVTPYTRKVMDALEVYFHREYFYVPFSNGDYPKEEQGKWEALREKAQKSYEADFADDCVEYCVKRNIGTISEETLKNCFEMPAAGVKVKHLYFEDCYYPILNSNFLDYTATKNLGHFCSNNGKVVFVYQNGKTYVAKGYKILGELRGAGYTEAGLFVPFSNGEEIVDATLRAHWEAITKN